MLLLSGKHADLSHYSRTALWALNPPLTDRSHSHIENFYLPQPLSERVNKSRGRFPRFDFQVSLIQLPWIFKNKKQLLSKELIWVSNLLQSSFWKTFWSCVQRYSKVQRSLITFQRPGIQGAGYAVQTVELPNSGLPLKKVSFSRKVWICEIPNKIPWCRHRVS